MLSDIRRNTIAAAAIIATYLVIRRKKAQAAEMPGVQIPPGVAEIAEEIPGMTLFRAGEAELPLEEAKNLFLRIPDYSIWVPKILDVPAEIIPINGNMIIRPR